MCVDVTVKLTVSVQWTCEMFYHVSSILVKCEHSSTSGLIQLIAEAYRKRPGALLCLNSKRHINTKSLTKPSY